MDMAYSMIKAPYDTKVAEHNPRTWKKPPSKPTTGIKYTYGNYPHLTLNSLRTVQKAALDGRPSLLA